MSCAKDWTCIAEMYETATRQNCDDLVIKRYDTGHWVGKEAAEELNHDLLKWMEQKSLV